MDTGPAMGHNVEPFAQILLGAGVSVMFHPMTYTKTLIQIGFEPLPPTPARSIFGRQVLAYPGVFKYLGHIRRTDGFLGMYRGLGARLVGGVIGSAVSTTVSQKLKARQPAEAEIEEDKDMEDEDAAELVRKLLKETTRETLSRCAGVIASHPFHVIMLRSMAQFVGRETHYSNILSSAVKIYNDEGILGFFAGLAPRLIGEVLTIWLVNCIVHAVNQFVLNRHQAAKGVRSYTNAICTMMVTQFTYPFSLVSNVMAVNSSGLAAGSPPYMRSYSSWTDCWSSLQAQGQLKRGSSLFWRHYKGPVVLRGDGKPMPAAMAWSS